nr:hypothetical protein CFP56_66475 [Quercus suber]
MEERSHTQDDNVAIDSERELKEQSRSSENSRSHELTHRQGAPQPTSEEIAKHPAEQDSVVRNIRLVVTPWTVTVFYTVPILAVASYLYITTRLDDDIFSSYFFGLSFPLMAICLAMMTSENIAFRLREAGFEQKRTIGRWAQLLISLAVCGFGTWWTQNWFDERDVISTGWQNVQLVISILVPLTGALLMTLGPVLFFTRRKR